ncbi:MAG: hypothetical protein ACFCVD_23915 [Nodosilinea sp.]
MNNTQIALYAAQASTPVQMPIAPTSATPTGLELTPILVALVTGVIGIATGVATGWITAIYAPKANWEVDKERSDYSRKIAIIKGLRETLNDKSKTVISVFDHPDFSHVEREFDSKDRADIKALKSEITDFINSYYKEKSRNDMESNPRNSDFIEVDLENDFDSSNILEFIKYVQYIEKHDSEIVNALRYLSLHGDIVNIILKKLCDLEVKWGLVNLQ